MATHFRFAPATVEATGLLHGRLVPWSTPATVSDDGGRTTYTEQFAPGGIVAAETVAVYASHTSTPEGRLERGPLIGRATALDHRDDGLWGTVELADTPAAQEVRNLAALLGAHFSIEFVDPSTPADPGGEVVRTDALLTGVSVILPPQRPAYTDAVVESVRNNQEPEPMSDTPIDVPDEDTPDTPEDAAFGRSAVVELVRSEVARSAVATPAAPSHTLGRFATFGEFVRAQAAGYSADLDAEFGRALADQTTPNNPGVVPPAWVRDVKGIVDGGRPAISAIGTISTGSGMEVNWPYFDGDLSTLVGNQATEKTSITSARVDIKKGDAPLKTYAGGSDVSLQLITRSDPSYLDAYFRILAAAYARVTDNAAAAGLAAAPQASKAHVVADLVAANLTGATAKAALFDASMLVEKATGTPATAVLAASNVFAKLASVTESNAYPVQNTAGTSSAASLSVNVHGLNVVHVESLAAGSCLVLNPSAAKWAEDGPHVIRALDVDKLGENVAVWGLGGLCTFVPKGIVAISKTAIS